MVWFKWSFSHLSSKGFCTAIQVNRCLFLTCWPSKWRRLLQLWFKYRTQDDFLLKSEKSNWMWAKRNFPPSDLQRRYGGPEMTKHNSNLQTQHGCHSFCFQRKMQYFRVGIILKRHFYWGKNSLPCKLRKLLHIYLMWDVVGLHWEIRRTLQFPLHSRGLYNYITAHNLVQ